MTILKNNVLDLLDPSFKSIFFQALKVEPIYDKIFNVMDSKMKTEKLSGISGFGLPAVKNDGQGITYDDPIQKYDKSFTHTTYSLGFRVSEEAVDDDLSGSLAKMPKELANSCMAGKETVHFQHFDRSQNGSYLGADGKVLCATDHPLVGGGSAANRPTANVDLSVTVLEDALTAMRTTVNDRGITTSIMPTILLIPPALEWLAIQLLENAEKSGTVNRDINAIRTRGLKYMISEYITDSDSWYLIADKSQHQLTSFTRKPIYMDSDTDFDTRDAKFMAGYRDSCGWVDWRGVYGSIGA